GPVRPHYLVERRALRLEARLEVLHRLAGVLLDAARDDLARPGVDRAYRRDVDHTAGLDGLAEADLRRSDRRGLGRLEALEAGLRPRDRLRRIDRRDAELTRRESDPVGLEDAHERRPDAGRLELADHLAVLERGLLEGEDVLHQDLVVLDPVDRSEERRVGKECTRRES